jgi:hypothetical protein
MPQHSRQSSQHPSAVQHNWHSLLHVAVFTDFGVTAGFAFITVSAKVLSATANTRAKPAAMNGLVRMIYLKGLECVHTINATVVGRHIRRWNHHDLTQPDAFEDLKRRRRDGDTHVEIASQNAVHRGAVHRHRERNARDIAFNFLTRRRF